MMLYVKNPKASTQKVLEQINEFSKVAGYKIIEKSVACLYISNKILEREHLEKSCLKSHQKEQNTWE